MQRLLNFILQNRAFFSFVALELLCAWLIVRNNDYQGAQFFNSSNAAAARVLNVSQSVNDYLHLKVVNKDLAEENARLRQLLDRRDNGRISADSVLIERYDFKSAKVVNNSIEMFRNFITIDKGSVDSIAVGMAVINSNKAIGKVKTVSDHFAVVISLLNLDEFVSATIKRTGNFGTIRWDGRNPRYTRLLYIPRHVRPIPGDSIVTSGFNTIFPEGILIGVVHQATLPANGPWEIEVELAQDFNLLQHVEVVRSLKKVEIDSIQNVTIDNLQ
jgi:rod shape-determining protein MreC